MYPGNELLADLLRDELSYNVGEVHRVGAAAQLRHAAVHILNLRGHKKGPHSNGPSFQLKTNTNTKVR